MGSIAYYPETTDPSRQDAAEGTAIYLDTQGVETTAINGNVRDHYVLCCSTGQVDLDYLCQKMGKHIVKIHDPLTLAQEMDRFLLDRGVPTLNGVHGRLVEYSKGEVKPGEHSSTDNFDLSLRQKSRSFQDECEYRLFVILKCKGSSLVKGTHLHIDLGKPLKCAEIL